MTQAVDIQLDYKESPVGLIPKEWDVSLLKDLCLKLNVGFVGTCEKFYTDAGNGILLIRTGNLYKDEFNLSSVKYVTREFHDTNKKSQTKEGDILIARHSNSGAAVLVPKGIQEANTLNIVIVRVNPEKLDNEYCTYCLNSDYVKRQVYALTAGSSQNVVNTKEIAKLKIPLPPLSEQRKIAAILSTWDEAIAKQRSLIELLTKRKKGLMQQLLKGEKRLPGFTEEWVRKSLGEYFQELKMKTTVKDQFPVMTSSRKGLVLQREYYGINRVTERDNVGFNVLPPLHFTYRSRSDDGLFKFNRNEKGITGCISKYYPVFKVVNGEPVFFKFFLDQMVREFYKYAVGSSQLVLSFKDLSSVKLRIPSLSEQKAIAKIIEKVDQENNLAITYLDRLIDQKKGLMQQLLTGKKRVK